MPLTKKQIEADLRSAKPPKHTGGTASITGWNDSALKKTFKPRKAPINKTSGNAFRLFNNAIKIH